MPNRAKHAFGSSDAVLQALQDKKINERDVLFLDENTDNPKIGWVDLQGKPVIIDTSAKLAELETELETQISTKADAEEVNAKIAEKADAVEVEEKLEKVATDSVAAAKAYTDGKVEAAVNEHLVKKYEITSLPEGGLVNYREGEIRILCPEGSVFTKQSVGTGGDPDCYYMTLKTYVFDDNVVGYREYLGAQADSETLTDLKTDQYGRKYQPTWLALAKYDEATDVWNYYGKNSSEEKFIGWDYRIDWYDANGVVVASDSIRINLANEECYFTSEPYYVGSIMKEVDTKIEEKIEEKIAEVEAAYEIVEF